MSLKHTILGFLRFSPKTGYDLQKKIKLTIEHFWPSTQSQVYRTLKELEEDDLIESEILYQVEKPNKKMYSLAVSGEEELRRWLSEPLDISPHRNALLVQLFFSRDIDSAVIIKNLTDHKEKLNKKRLFLKSGEVRARIELGTSVKEKALFQIILENGTRVLESEIAWTDYAIARMREIEEQEQG